MNPPELLALAERLDLASDARFSLRVAFGIACVERVTHLLTDPAVAECLVTGKSWLAGECDEDQLDAAAARAAALAAGHPGSGVIDGAGSAAVSTSYGVAAALAGRALVAAEYAAYAAVYAYAAHAVTDPTAYADEHAWQLARLRTLSERYLH